MSEAFYALVNLVDEIDDFDESMAKDGRRGNRLRSILVKCDRTKRYELARRAMGEINNMAKRLVVEAGQRLLALRRQLKILK